MDDHDCLRSVDSSGNTNYGDVLGNEGRKLLNACVKVKIYGKPETRRYNRKTALKRLEGCIEPMIPRGCYNWLCIDELLLPTRELHIDRDGNRTETYTIADIHDSLVKLEDIPYVEKYPKVGPGSEETRVLIDKRRDAVERELEEAKASPYERQRYSFTVAQRRVRDCFANNFAGNQATIFPREPLSHTTTYDIKTIYDAVNLWEGLGVEMSSFSDGPMYEKIHANRVSIERDYKNALASPGTAHKYSRDDAEQRLRSCYCSTDDPFQGLRVVFRGEVDISELREALHNHDEWRPLPYKYPEEGPGSEELRKSIDEHRAKMNEEYETYVASPAMGQKPHKYSPSEAEHRVRDCFAGTFIGDEDMFPLKKDQSGMPRFYQTFDIFDIKESIEYFDVKKFFEDRPEGQRDFEELRKVADELRNSIKEEYKVAIGIDEIEHGSGFLISDHFILTNKHVIETYLDDKNRYAICISNAAIGKQHCEVAHSDPGKDLALLYCPAPNLPHCRISPMQLSTQSLLPGMQIFTFGYPMSHTEETALFVTGNVSGSKRTLSGHSKAVLNCSLNSGNSGGPVLSWVDGQVRVVGIATQKHFKEILTLDELNTIEKIRESLQTYAITDVLDHDVQFLQIHGTTLTPYLISMHLLSLKLYDALETHSQFNLSNALPGELVVEFIKNFIPEYKGEHKEELDKVIELSQ